ncbi:MAG: ROK family protein [Planctomycetia bacterium]|nr:ROK family protein [Planctomycetia bacterium]
MTDTRRTIPSDQAVPPLFAGIDLGGTNIKIGLVDDRGALLGYQSVPTEIHEGPEAGARRMADVVRQIADGAGIGMANVARVGLATPGTMDIPAGRLIKPVNLPGWNDFPIRDRVSHHCGRPVTYANDADAAAYGEFWLGAGREMHSLVMLTLGTGVGGGIIIGDLSIAGEHSHGSELGHIIIDIGPNARMCGCGQTGHLEAYCSATAVVRRTEEALQAGRASSLSAAIAGGAELTALLIDQHAEREDPLAVEIVDETARLLGIGIVTLLHTVDPSGVLIGGAMTFGREGSPVGRKFIERIRQEVRRRALPVVAAAARINYAELGSDAGFFGAAGLARADFHRKPE